jgi:lysophosphatidic acid acyltransferase/lysophosphatidylinositol acyltransferase
MAQYWAKTKLVLNIDNEDLKMLGKEKCLCVLNHKYDIDWLMGWVLCQRVNLLAVSF